jgi:hypothetical protein
MNTSNPLPQVFGWLLGGLSLLILVGDLISLLLHQSVHFLTYGYNAVLAACFDFVTRWISSSWFSISGLERHLIVILVVCQTALMSAFKIGGNYIVYATSIFLISVFYTIVFGIMPDGFRLLPTVIAIVALLLPVYIEKAGDIRAQGYSGNLIGITVFFFIIATINYVLRAF